MVKLVLYKLHVLGNLRYAHDDERFDILEGLHKYEQSLRSALAFCSFANALSWHHVLEGMVTPWQSRMRVCACSRACRMLVQTIVDVVDDEEVRAIVDVVDE